MRISKKALLAFEGLDQSGKKTQVELLTKRLEERGYHVEKIAFPDYNTLIGKEIKAFLYGEREYNIQVRHILYAANRWERKEDIDRWLNEEKFVIVDRYSPSNLAYGVAHGLDINWLLNLEKGLPKADLVIVIDTSPEVSFERKYMERDIYERDLQFLKKVRGAYSLLSKKFNWIIVNGERPVKNIHEDIWKVINRHLK
ncbi:MAG: putative thymidylate kinase [Candidatus Bathyarchaeota archaeon BA1]|nr:MAG: putative thymidylate kinase [Candidatus Bathyarchaeota archaeon BA1]